MSGVLIKMCAVTQMTNSDQGKILVAQNLDRLMGNVVQHKTLLPKLSQDHLTNVLLTSEEDKFAATNQVILLWTDNVAEMVQYHTERMVK